MIEGPTKPVSTKLKKIKISIKMTVCLTKKINPAMIRYLSEPGVMVHSVNPSIW